ncbi:M48 family metalloprotease [Sorangium sp. So ce1128]
MSIVAFVASFAAFFAVLGLLGAGAVGIAARRARGLSWDGRGDIPALRAAAVIFAPALIALLGTVAFASPARLFSPRHCATHGLYHLHLCPHHPEFALPLVVPAAGLVAAWLAHAAPSLRRLTREIRTAARRARAVRRLPVAWMDGVPLRVADCGAPTAFTVGAFAPVIIIDRRLLGALTEEARRAVAHHEEAHFRRRDALTLIALRLALALFPIPGGDRLIDAWRAAAERECDRYAAVRLRDAGAVAAALVAVERARVGAREHPPPALALGAPAGVALEQRVHALLELVEAGATAPRLRNDALDAALAALAAAALVSVWPGGSFHDAVETVLGRLVSW